MSLLPGIIAGLLAAGPAVADPLCPNPLPNVPALSMSLISYGPGDLTRNCRDRLAVARASGFTAVTIVPAFLFETTDRPGPGIGGSLRPGATLAATELTACLDVAWEMGMDIIYKPHLSSRGTLSGAGEQEWKANFDVHPDRTYEETLFGEFDRWLASRRSEIARGRQRVDVVMSGELEFSTSHYPQEWFVFQARYRARLSAMGLGGRVRLGVNPNWDPRHRDGLADMANCVNYRLLMDNVDFIAPSFYGDLSGPATAEPGPEGARAFEARRQAVTGRLTYWRPRGRRGTQCDVSGIGRRPFALGEFGVGGSIARSEDDQLPACGALSGWYASRRQVYQNLLGWAQATYPNSPLFLNLWTDGVFDPTGAGRGHGRALPDCRLVHTLRRYSMARCPGLGMPAPMCRDIEPTLSAAPPVPRPRRPGTCDRDGWTCECPVEGPGTNPGGTCLTGPVDVIGGGLNPPDAVPIDAAVGATLFGGTAGGQQ